MWLSNEEYAKYAGPLNESKCLDAITSQLMDKWGDEGHDIGDAGSIEELVGNMMTIAHQSYTVEMAYNELFRLFEEEVKMPKEVYGAFIIRAVLEREGLV